MAAVSGLMAAEELRTWTFCRPAARSSCRWWGTIPPRMPKLKATQTLCGWHIHAWHPCPKASRVTFQKAQLTKEMTNGIDGLLVLCEAPRLQEHSNHEMARHVHTTSSMPAMHENYVWRPWTLLLGVPKLEHTMDLPSYDHLHSTLLLFMPKLEVQIGSHKCKIS